MSTLCGTLLLDKPLGITSAQAVARVKRLLPKGTKIGHTGTLDPLASGLLVLLVGRATRLSRYVTDLDKTYTATASFGAVSDTLDADGKITVLKDAPMPDEAALRAATTRFTGTLRQTPPMASAVKVKGERLYKAHRRGENVERKSRLITVHSLILGDLDPVKKTATFTVTCSSGTYVRALISDLAESIGTGAYLTALRRTQVGHLKLENASTPEKLTSATIQSHIIQTRNVVAHLPAVEVSGGERSLVCNGRALAAFGVEGSYRVEAGGELLAIYGEEEGARKARAEVVLCVG
ncbi:MAG: tRNA pseudouridine(55) synthase TruB [Actinomycetota bacterium]|nr:tRNA pseudouridine(55) synthase TruB [Actinomycetota bacterium]